MSRLGQGVFPAIPLRARVKGSAEGHLSDQAQSHTQALGSCGSHVTDQGDCPERVGAGDGARG